MITYFQEISNADFWQIAGITSLETASDKIGESVNITFKWGRTDCPTSPTDNENDIFPNPSMNRNEMLTWFSETDFGFGMNERQVRVFAQTAPYSE